MIISTADALRRFWLIALICLVMVAGAAVWLTTSAKASHWVWKGWERLFGPASVNDVRPRILAQTGGSGAYTITPIDEPSAGTSAVEGTIVIGVNASGAMTGAYSDQAGVAHGFVYANGTFTSFDALNESGLSPKSGWFQGTTGTGIDTAGDVVGAYADTNNATHGFLREAANPNTITVLDDPSAPTATSSRGTFPMAINDNGQIVGFYTTGSYDTASLYHGFLYSVASGTWTEIDEPNAGTGEYDNNNKEGTVPVAINASGVVTGYYSDSSGTNHGFIYSSGNYTSFDAPGAFATGHSGLSSGTVPTSIDTAGDVVGSYTDSTQVRHGFIRTASGTITVFDAPGATTTSQSGSIGGTISGTMPIHIDPTGSYITGIYTDSSGLGHGFVYYLPLTGSGSFTTFTPPNMTTSTSLPIQGVVFSVNASGTVVGFYLDDNEVAHGFQYTPTATPTPSFNPGQGTYGSDQSVAISDTDTSATIYYTTDGSTPTASSTKYTEPISVSSTETINAIALDSTTGGYIESAEASATYTISIPTNPAPVISGLSPAYTSAGGAAFTLTVSGSGFVSSSTVYWGSTALTTTYGSATTLTAQVPAADIASAGMTSITVQTPTPGGGTSNSLQFEVDSGTSGSGPTFTTLTATVAPGSTASYSVTLPSGATNVSVTCLNLPTGASCSYSSSTGAVTITTSATTPAGTYQITVVFTETLPGAATGFVLFPFLLLPLLLIRKRLAARGIWLTVCLVFALTAGVACAVGCGGGGSGPSQTHQVTSSGVVTLKVQ